MSMVIEGGDDVFNALVYGGPLHQSTATFLQQSASNFMSSLSTSAQAFFQAYSPAHIFKRYDENEALRLARAAFRKVNNLWNADIIEPIHDIGKFQNAGSIMQRWIMANPMARQLFHNQQCFGYDGTYFDLEPGLRGMDHYDYRRVVNGVFMDQPNGEFAANIFFEELRDGDASLRHLEQMDILETWGALESYMRKRSDDPTDPKNGSL